MDNETRARLVLRVDEMMGAQKSDDYLDIDRP